MGRGTNMSRGMPCGRQARLGSLTWVSASLDCAHQAILHSKTLSRMQVRVAPEIESGWWFILIATAEAASPPRVRQIRLGKLSQHACGKFLATGKRDLLKTHHSPAVLRATAERRDLIPWFDCISFPVGPGKHSQAAKLCGPLFDFTLVVFHVEMDVGMRIRPLELRDGSFHGDHLRHVILRRRMVRIGQARYHKQTS